MRKKFLFYLMFLVLFSVFIYSLIIGQKVNSSDARKYTREEVIAFVEKAVNYTKFNGKEKALKEFMDKNGKFIKGELYIYAYDFNGTVISHGGQSKLVGQNLIGMTDANGVQIIKELIRLAKQSSGWLEYLWPNPEHGNRIEPKAGYVMKVDDTWFLGSGIYEPVR
ncbi:MAG: cache domain-containing protein [Candidatus Saelkia tenebricola]|nr:cache domain-containing protein [Candidatus Saelkia tenebricola]